MDPLLVAQDLLVGYGEPVAPPVSFTLDAGHVLAVVGPNGAGKSTVLRTVLGLLEPLEGTVTLLGDAVDERRASHRAAVAAVMDEDTWFPALTVREHLELTAAGHGHRRPAHAVDPVLDTFGLLALADTMPETLSSGQRRRVLLASAFVRPRRLLVLDEPEQRLDGALRRRLVDLVRDEAEAGGAVLLATHDPHLLGALGAPALGLADDTCVLLDADEAAEFMAR